MICKLSEREKHCTFKRETKHRKQKMETRKENNKGWSVTQSGKQERK